MAVATGALRRRQREDAKVEAKSKRDKIILAVGGVVLLVVLAIEVPGLLSSGSSSTPPPAPAPAATPSAPAAAGAGAVTPASVRAALREIARLPSKDPFKPQLLANSASTGGAPAIPKAPAVRAKHFVLKDPFKVQIGQASGSALAPIATPPPVTPTPTTHKVKTSSSSAQSGYIVILRSLDTKASAQQEVKKAKAQGLQGASILYSSKYTTLRRGYWVVYLSTYPTVAAADAGLQEAHSHGYASAYRRPIKK